MIIAIFTYFLSNSTLNFIKCDIIHSLEGIFMISKTIALDVLNAGLATGADFAEIFVEEKSNTGLSIDNE